MEMSELNELLLDVERMRPPAAVVRAIDVVRDVECYGLDPRQLSIDSARRLPHNSNNGVPMLVMVLASAAVASAPFSPRISGYMAMSAAGVTLFAMMKKDFSSSSNTVHSAMSRIVLLSPMDPADSYEILGCCKVSAEAERYRRIKARACSTLLEADAVILRYLQQRASEEEKLGFKNAALKQLSEV